MKGSIALAIALLVPAISYAKKDDRPVLDGAGAAKSVVLCKSTLSDLQARLGAPTRDGIIHSSRVVSWVTEWEPLARYLAVMVNDQGMVVDLYWNVPTEISWAPVDQCQAR